MRLFLFPLFCFITACTHVANDGYLEAPSELIHVWDANGPFLLEFTSPNTYQHVYVPSGVPQIYEEFKIFHRDGEYMYAIVKTTSNSTYFDGNPHDARKLTPEEIGTSDDISYSYQLFHLKQEPTVYGPWPKDPYDISVFWYLRIYDTLCSRSYPHEIEVTKEHFHLPAHVHWERIQPENGCRYYEGLPASSSTSHYDRHVPVPRPKPQHQEQ